MSLRYFHNGHPSDAATFGSDEAPGQMDWAKMFGDVLRTASGAERPTSEVLQGKKNVVAFFAGSWCPWCRGFEPLITQTYNKLKAQSPDDTEIVYLSVDENIEKYNEYLSTKQWVAVPYDKAQGNGCDPLSYIRKKVREETGKKQGTLGEKFEVKSVPTVIVMNGTTGEVTHKDFVLEKGKAEDGHEWSPKAPSSWLDVSEMEMPAMNWSKMLGDVLRVSSGEERPTADVLKGKKRVALLFAGEWCPWCRAFTPLMKKTYEKVKAQNPNDTELVYISVDENVQKFNEAVSDKSWVAIPYDKAQGNGCAPLGYIRKKVREAEKKSQGTLGTQLGVSSVPFLVVLDGESGLITHKNDIVVEKNPEKSEDGHEFAKHAPESWLA